MNEWHTQYHQLVARPCMASFANTSWHICGMQAHEKHKRKPAPSRADSGALSPHLHHQTQLLVAWTCPVSVQGCHDCVGKLKQLLPCLQAGERMSHRVLCRDQGAISIEEALQPPHMQFCANNQHNISYEMAAESSKLDHCR